MYVASTCYLALKDSLCTLKKDKYGSMMYEVYDKYSVPTFAVGLLLT